MVSPDAKPCPKFAGISLQRSSFSTNHPRISPSLQLAIGPRRVRHKAAEVPLVVCVQDKGVVQLTQVPVADAPALER